MSYVERVTKKHLFEDSLRGLMRYLSAMTREEIELALAHIADDIVASAPSSERECSSAKGTVVKIYLEMRNVGDLKQSLKERKSFRDEISCYALNVGEREYQEACDDRAQKIKLMESEYKDALAKYDSDYAEWNRERKKLSIFKRIFYDVPPPTMPLNPPIGLVPWPKEKRAYIEDARRRCADGDFFVDAVRKYELLYPIDYPVELTRESLGDALGSS